uniref:tumor necrosis factor receptor superfamily member 21 isoform X2 n=1 Tax=Monopterus albus TaxID=43700 RepID=UPI0009B491A9|nr:tumor necrosis factor receptor superfamily member 21 isoform X2 [Monopterus albus]
MHATCVSAVLLYTVVVDISWVLTTPSSADQPIFSPRHYRHTDPESGAQLVCNKCPAGTYVSAHCSPSAVRECSPCPEGTFTRGENGVQQCHRCRAMCPAGFIEKAPCMATQDRICTCPPNSFFSVSGGIQCKPHSLCPPGTRVKKRGSETEDVICKLCTKGTFSDVKSSAMRCHTHTDCQARGLVLLTPGTRETDNVCGFPPTVLSSSSSFSTTTRLGPPQVVLVQAFLTSSPSPSSPLTGPGHKGTYRQSAAIQLRESPSGEDHLAEGLLLSQPGTPSPYNRDPPRTPPTPAHKQPVNYEQQWGQPTSDLLPGHSKWQLEGVEGTDIVRVGTGSQIAGHGNGGGRGGVSGYYRPTRRGTPRLSTHNHFDINEHLPWMIVLLLLLMLVVIVVCSMKRSSQVLKNGPVQDPGSIMEKAIQKKPSASLTQFKEKWIYYSNGQGVDILKLVAAQVGTQWIDIYQSLANATGCEVAAFSSDYSSDHARAYAALQHWTIWDSDANLAKLINVLHRQRRIDVVEKIRCVMEDNLQFDINQLMTTVNVSQSLSPIHKPLESPVDRTKAFFPDESEPLLRCDSTSSKDSALSRNGSFITKAI